MTLQLIHVPNPILFKKAEPVSQVDDEVRTIMDQINELLVFKGNGVGLGANQVGILKRVMVLNLGVDDDEQRPEGFYPLKMANPVMISHSDETAIADEGCLSVPGVRIKVKRYKEVEFEYLDYNNKKQTIKAKSWLARVLQHEFEHLDGITLVNHMSPIKRKIYMDKLKKRTKIA